ncbi:calcium-binding protein [Inquilinus sp. CA228]|uniref:calcium-binding protein n=1 Tax=Inquilinus sp. CA228 TaxID=3455609 RepID=UPI003F8D532C
MALVNGTAGNDLIHVAGDGLVAPPGFTDIPQATALNDTLNGLGGTDAIYGGDGNDLIDGGDGNDSLVGGAGADTLLGGAGIDVVSYGGAARVLVNLTTGHGFEGDAEGDVFNGIENLNGTGFGDSLTGSAVANTLTGLGGNDVLFGRDGNDMLNGGDGNDYLDGDAGDDTLNGGDGIDELFGNDGNDTVSGGAGDDVLYSSTGADHLDGGAGIDALSYEGVTGVTVDLTTGLGAGGDVISGVENIEGTFGHGDTLTGSAAANGLTGRGGDDILSGLAGDDQLVGGSGDDILRGGAGADALDGSSGIDLVSFYGAAAAVTVFLSTGIGNNGDAEGDTYAAIENVNGGTAGDVVFGSADANVLNGFEGNDQLIGLDGNDTLDGGVGDDLLSGRIGADTLRGGAGIDIILYSGTAAVTVNLSTGLGTGGDAEGDVISGVENIVGTVEFGDTLIGSSVANRLQGQGGNDVLNGLGGADMLFGDAGSDIVSGGDGDDFLHVSAGVDVIDGGAGRDTIVFDHAMVCDFQATVFDADIAGDFWPNFEVIQGSAGDDLIRTTAFFALELRGGAGNDTLATAVDAAFGDTLSGEDGNDSLDGGVGDDVLRGGAGADALAGAAGTDTASYYSGTVGVVVSLASGLGGGGEAQGDTLSGIENLSGSQGSDSLYGDAGANVLQGWNGNDALFGRAGKDTLTGGAGTDRFTFTALSDSVVGANADRITDFSHAQGDRIDLAAIDARTSVAGDQAFSFIGTGLFTGVTGQLRFAFTSPGVTTIAGDVNGDKVSDFHITLTGTITLVAGDFVL